MPMNKLLNEKKKSKLHTHTHAGARIHICK